MSTPSGDESAAQSTLFSQAYPTDIPTQPSRTALFTRQYGLTTGIVLHPPAMLTEEVTWLPSVLTSLGHRTAAVDHLFAMRNGSIRGDDDCLVPPGRSP